MNREEIVKWLESLKHYIGKAKYSDLWHYEQVVDMAIEALRVQEWIPCSEKLPKECDGHVLVSEEDGQVTTGLHSEFSNMWYIGDMCGVGGCKVIAWMPLPEPYKAESEDKE